MIINMSRWYINTMFKQFMLNAEPTGGVVVSHAEEGVIKMEDKIFLQPVAIARNVHQNVIGYSKHADEFNQLIDRVDCYANNTCLFEQRCHQHVDDMLYLLNPTECRPQEYFKVAQQLNDLLASPGDSHVMISIASKGKDTWLVDAMSLFDNIAKQAGYKTSCHTHVTTEPYKAIADPEFTLVILISKDDKAFKGIGMLSHEINVQQVNHVKDHCMVTYEEIVKNLEFSIVSEEA